MFILIIAVYALITFIEVPPLFKENSIKKLILRVLTNIKCKISQFLIGIFFIIQKGFWTIRVEYIEYRNFIVRRF